MAATVVVFLAETLIQEGMNNFEIGIIISLQDGHKQHGSVAMFLDEFGFPPAIWGFFPGIALVFLPDPAFRLTAFRIIILNSLGRYIKWNLNLDFQQGL